MFSSETGFFSSGQSCSEWSRQPLDEAYARAMEEVAQRYPDDLHAQTLAAAAMMNTTRRVYWNKDGSPKPITEKFVALLESVLFPSAGISHNYESYVAALVDGTVLTGLMISQTPDSVTIRNTEAIDRTVKRSEIEELKKQTISLMPADIQKTMTAAELVDVIEYLTTLRRATVTKPGKQGGGQ